MALSNDEILEAIAAMTVQQAADLVKAMEEKFGVTATEAAAAAPNPDAAADDAAAAGEVHRRSGSQAREDLRRAGEKRAGRRIKHHGKRAERRVSADGGR